MDPTDRPALRPEVSLRPERFGALAYHFGNRRLSFLKHPDLVTVVRSLDGTVTVGRALAEAGVDRSRWPAFLAALDTLERSEMLDVPGRGTPPEVPSGAASADLPEAAEVARAGA